MKYFFIFPIIPAGIRPDSGRNPTGSGRNPAGFLADPAGFLTGINSREINFFQEKKELNFQFFCIKNYLMYHNCELCPEIRIIHRFTILLLLSGFSKY
jgi:hypothetical protein